MSSFSSQSKVLFDLVCYALYSSYYHHYQKALKPFGTSVIFHFGFREDDFLGFFNFDLQLVVIPFRSFYFDMEIKVQLFFVFW